MNIHIMKRDWGNYHFDYISEVIVTKKTKHLYINGTVVITEAQMLTGTNISANA